jgi:uncharacterized protein (TIGR02588 family)
MAKTAAKRQKPAKSLIERTPICEWLAAGTGLVLTLVVIGYLIFDGVTAGDGPPELSVAGAPAQAVAGGFVVPMTVRNDGATKAAEVEVLGTLERGGAVIEERRARFAHVPAEGEAMGGLVFETDPRTAQLRLTAQGYAEP